MNYRKPILFSDNFYDVLKFIVNKFLPGLIIFLGTIFTYFEIPWGAGVIVVLKALNEFLRYLMNESKDTYYNGYNDLRDNKGDDDNE